MQNDTKMQERFKRPNYNAVNFRRSRKLLISTEGYTERDLLDDYRIRLRIPEQIIRIQNSPATDPLSIVNDLVADVEKRKRDKTFVPYMGDWALAVFDVDEHLHNTAMRTRFLEAIQTAQRQSITLITSNPCVENWLNLHYAINYANHDRHVAIADLRLKTIFKDYAKRLESNMLDDLFLRTEKSRKNAFDQHKTSSLHSAKKHSEEINPHTRLHQVLTLIDSIARKYKRK